MKKHLCIIKDENGVLTEVVLFSELSARELKKVDTRVVHVLSSERVAHPSPETLVTALKLLGVDVSTVYAECYKIELTKQE